MQIRIQKFQHWVQSNENEIRKEKDLFKLNFTS